MTPLPPDADARRAAIQQRLEEIANSLHGVVLIGWAPTVNPKNFARQLETNLREIMEQLARLLAEHTRLQQERDSWKEIYETLLADKRVTVPPAGRSDTPGE